MPQLTRTRRVLLIALGIFVVALAVRLVHLAQIRDAPFFTVLLGDARSYDEWARRIAGGDWFGSEVFYQAPLYPYFLGVVYALAGHDVLAVRIVQAVLGSGACVLIALTARRLFGDRAGIVAGLMLALYAPAVFFDGVIQKSVLDVFFMCVALYLLSGITGPATDGSTGEAAAMPPATSRRSWLLLGIAMGALSLTRENALLLAAVIGAWALVRPRLAWPRAFRAGTIASGAGSKGPGVRRTPRSSTARTAHAGTPAGPLDLAAALAFAAGLALVLAPVAIRNNIVGGGFYITTAQFGPNFYIGNNAASDGTYQSLRFGRGSPEYERVDATELAELALRRRLTPGEVSSYWTGRALDYITSQPGDWLALMGRKVLLLWNATEMLDTESQETYAEHSLPLRVLGWFGHFGLLVPLAAFGVWTTWPARRRLIVFYALGVVYAASVLLFYVFARYRFPLVPILVLFAAPGLLALPTFLRSAPRAQQLRAAAVGAAILVFVNWPLLSKPLMQAITENNLATALQAEGRYDEALHHYRRAIELQPAYAPAFSNMGTAYRAQGRLDEAIATYQRAIEAQPEYPDAHYNLANALLEKKQPEKAAEHFRIALQKIPGSAGVHNNLGIALADEGRMDEAITAFQQALVFEPGSARAHRNLGNALAAKGRPAEAVPHLARAAELEPNNAENHYDLATVLLQMQQFPQAAGGFQRALELDPNSAGTHNNLAIALASMGRIDEARRHWQEALRLDPGFADAKQNLALLEQAARASR